MRSHFILYRNSNEYSYSPLDPWGIWAGQVNLAETCLCCMSSDDFRQVECKRYEVREVSLPDWLEPSTWVVHSIGFRYLKGRGVPVADQLDVTRLLTSNNRVQTAAGILLRTKSFRSEFRRSLNEQLRIWLAGGGEHPSPFSPRQLEVLLAHLPDWSIRRRDESLSLHRTCPFEVRVLSAAEAYALAAREPASPA